MPVEQMKDTLSQRAYRNWQLYWVEEPWGPVRDNLHTAIIAREIRRPQQAAKSAIPLDQFMVASPAEQERRAAAAAAEKKASILSWFRRVAKKRVIKDGDDRPS